MSAAREEILARVRAGAGGGAPESSAAYRRAGSLTAPDRVDLFAARVGDYRADVRRVRPAEIGAVVAELAGGAALGVPPGLPAAWRPPAHVEDTNLSLAQLDDLAGVVTGCSVAIAETGTIVLSGGPAEGRRALTLVPDLHVCVVEAERVVETVPEAFDRLAVFATRPLTLVSGPSATSDIELRRVEGVHGPRRLVVLIVEEGSEDG